MSASGVRVSDGVMELYIRFRTMMTLTGPYERAEAVREFVAHPACRSKQRMARARVTRTAVCRRDLRADVLQGAVCAVIQRLQSPTLRYSDEGPYRFGGWLYRLWLNAFRASWRAIRAEEKRWSRLARPERLADVVPMAEYDRTHDDRLTLVLEVIHSLDDRELAGFLSDWLAGLSVAESARRRRVSPATVCRRREAGLTILRQALAEHRNPPP